MNPSTQKLAQRMQKRKEQGELPYVLLLGSSLSLTPAVRRTFAGTGDWEVFWREIRSTSPTNRKALLKGPLNALGLEPGYQAVARLAEAGYFSLILTLNVDDALDNALKALKTLPASEYRIWVHGEVTSQEIATTLDRPTPRIKVVKLRGDINARKLPLTPKAQFEFPPDLEDAVTRWLSRDTIVMGDLPFDDDVQRCLRSGDDELWCILPDEPASGSFIMRARQSRPSGEIITGADVEFNAFFTGLAERFLEEVKERDRGEICERHTMPVVECLPSGEQLLDDSDYREIKAEMRRELDGTAVTISRLEDQRDIPEVAGVDETDREEIAKEMRAEREAEAIPEERKDERRVKQPVVSHLSDLQFGRPHAFEEAQARLSQASFKADESIRKLQAVSPGRKDARLYEECVFEILCFLFEPELTEPEFHSETGDRVQIRDIVFFNDSTHQFWMMVRQAHNARNIVFELKNTKSINNRYIDQLAGYLTDALGHFGVLVTRAEPPTSVIKKAKLLYNSDRKVVLVLSVHKRIISRLVV